MEFRLVGVAAAAVLAVYVSLVWMGRRSAVDTDDGATVTSLWEIAISSVVVGIFAGRVAAMVGDGVNPVANPRDLLIVRAGVATGWATVAGVGTAAWLGRRNPLVTLDALAPAAVLGLAVWSGGCVIRGTCLGTPTALPWAVHQTGSPVGRHPVELYVALALLLVAAALMWWSDRPTRPLGTLAGAALAATGLVRLLTEPFRLSLGGGPVWWYVSALGLGLGIMAAVILMRQTRPRLSSD